MLVIGVSVIVFIPAAVHGIGAAPPSTENMASNNAAGWFPAARLAKVVGKVIFHPPYGASKLYNIVKAIKVKSELIDPNVAPISRP